MSVEDAQAEQIRQRRSETAISTLHTAASDAA